MRIPGVAIFFAALSWCGTAGAAGMPGELRVEARDVARPSGFISFPTATTDRFDLVDLAGKTFPVQVVENRAWFIGLPLAKGEARDYRVVKARAAAGPGIRAAGGKLEIGTPTGRWLEYQERKSSAPRKGIKPELERGGYLHPIFSPGGEVVTDDYPTGHLHHHGIWFSWAQTVFQDRSPDFWNMGTGTGTVESLGVEQRWSGPVLAGFRARHRFVDLGTRPPTDALEETWRVDVADVTAFGRPFRVIDFVSTQRCATPDPLRLPEYRYGGVGYRGRAEWNGKTNCVVLTSDGISDRAAADATRARWCYLGGKTGRGISGVAILSAPDNHAAPQALRVHPDEPFLCISPQRVMSLAIVPGTPFVSRYRMLVFDGMPVREELELLWLEYMHPAQVTGTGW